MESVRVLFAKMIDSGRASLRAGSTSNKCVFSDALVTFLEVLRFHVNFYCEKNHHENVHLFVIQLKEHWWRH